MHILFHCLDLLEPPGFATAVIAAWAVTVRLCWRRGKGPLAP